VVCVMLDACVRAGLWLHLHHAGLEGSRLMLGAGHRPLATPRFVLVIAWMVNGEIDVAPGSSPSAEGEFGRQTMSLRTGPQLPSPCHCSPPPASLCLGPYHTAVLAVVHASEALTRAPSLGLLEAPLDALTGTSLL
jgi:hypothetical protein